MPSEHRPLTWLLALLALVVVACVVHISRGAGPLVGFFDVFRELSEGNVSDDQANTIVWFVRLPRMFAALLAGAILGAVGAVFQAFFRNPLAEPYVIGVSSGAGVGGTLAVVIGLTQALETLGIVVLAFVGGMLSLALVMALARRRGGVQVHTLLLAGVVTSAMLSAVMTTILMIGGQDTGVVLRWLLGSLATTFPPRLWAMALALIVGLAILQRQTRRLNAFSVSDFTSERLGIDPRRLRAVVLTTGTAMVSVAVGAVGIIGFLGLMAPHIARRIVGIDLRWSLAASAMVGSVLLLLADLAAQNLHPDYELPVGAVTALIGAPALLWLLKKEG